jgi:hypothetical protein
MDDVFLIAVGAGTIFLMVMMVILAMLPTA